MPYIYIYIYLYAYMVVGSANSKSSVLPLYRNDMVVFRNKTSIDVVTFLEVLGLDYVVELGAQHHLDGFAFICLTNEILKDVLRVSDFAKRAQILAPNSFSKIHNCQLHLSTTTLTP